MEAFAHCDELRLEAEAAKARGEERVAELKYLEAILATRRLWKPVRFHCLQQYDELCQSRLLRTSPDVPFTADQLQKVTSIAEDTNELVSFRAKLYLHLAVSAASGGQIALSVLYHRSNIKAVEESRAKAQRTRETGGATEWDTEVITFDGVTEVSVRMGSLIEQTEREAKLALKFGESAILQRWEANKDLLAARMDKGGDKCDCCSKNAVDIKTDGFLQDGELLQCSNCKKAYYCGAVCQVRPKYVPSLCHALHYGVTFSFPGHCSETAMEGRTQKCVPSPGAD